MAPLVQRAEEKIRAQPQGQALTATRRAPAHPLDFYFATGVQAQEYIPHFTDGAAEAWGQHQV